ncbi:hypothetical protein TWF694_011051 [Orbilia ellipsospora]|uniref:Nucleoside phosphorylase domain-containing protein n=1 Tax=Orbilia ellipsospora TaxID=2528407 RepID=A0AAV9XAG0_9PEZI
MSRPALKKEDYTVVWLTAIPIEYEIAQLMLDEVHDNNFHSVPGGSYVYQAGEVCGHNVIIATLPKEYGNSSAAALASEVKICFPNLRFGLLVGVAAGLPNLSKGKDIRLGDVLVGESIVAYDLGKITKDGFEPLLDNVTKPDMLVASAFRNLEVKNDPKIHLQYYEKIINGDHRDRFKDPGEENDHGGGCAQNKREKRLDSERHRVWYGRIGSGDKVVKYDQTSNELRDRYDIIGLEMEAAGVMKCMPVGVIRGVCDYGTQSKDKKWQSYAAATAAAYAKAVLKTIPPNRTLGMYRILDNFI